MEAGTLRILLILPANLQQTVFSIGLDFTWICFIKTSKQLMILKAPEEEKEERQ